MRALVAPLASPVGARARAVGLRARRAAPAAVRVSADAYREAARAAGIAALVDEMRVLEAGDPRLAAVAAEARARLLTAPLPGAVDDAVRAAAGDAGVDGLRRAWASWWSDEAVHDRALRGVVDGEGLDVVVVGAARRAGRRARGAPAAGRVGVRAIARARERAARWRAALCEELFPERPFPVDADGAPRLFSAFVEATVAPFGGRALDVDELFEEQEGVVTRMKAALPVRPTVRVLWRPLLSLWRTRAVDPATLLDDPLVHEVRARAHRLERQDFARASPEELFAVIDDANAVGLRVATLRGRYLPPALRDAALLWILLLAAGERARFAELVAGGGDTLTLAMNRGLEELAARVRAEPSLRRAFSATEPARLVSALAQSQPGRAFLAAFRAFLDEHGHRGCGGPFTATAPSFRAAPEIPLAAVRALAAGPPTAPQAARTYADADADDAIAPPLRTLYRRTLAHARHLPRVREDTRALLGLGLPAIHAARLELGRRLVAVGALDGADDVLHLTADEVRAALARRVAPSLTRALAAARAQGRAAAPPWRAPPPRRALALDLDLDLDGDGDGGGGAAPLLRGVAASAGVAEGAVRVLRGPEDWPRLLPGEVLVAPRVTPAWTALFLRAAAVVVDTGGALSPAALVAREYRVPAVLGTVDGTRALADGRRVRVDGSRGLVLSA